MANESNDIGDIVKKSKILILDIEGTTTSISFVKDKLFPYVEENVKEFLDSGWDQDDVKEAVTALRKLALEDQEKSVEGVVTIPGEDASKEDQIEGLVNNVKWQMSSDRKVGALKQLQGLIWKKGYDKGDIKGHIYDDVLPAIELWRATEGHKVYIYSSGSVQAQKLLFGQSSAGDLLPLIDGHFDTAVGAKQEAASYAAIVEKIGCKPEEILFLTDIEKEGEAARTSGLNVALVSREGNAPLPAEATASYPVLHSFAQLTVTNKRKPDVVQDEQPAKVPKTDTNDDVKTNTEGVELLEKNASVSVAEKIVGESEKMEVEEETVVKGTEEPKLDVPESVDSVTEVTLTNEATDSSAGGPESVVAEEKGEKTDMIETEKMDTEPTENVVTVEEPQEVVKSVEEKVQIAEETPTTIITEIEDITEDKQSLSEVADIIEDLEPVIEEPSTVEDMEHLQNVGEVLEKECDEILSKVQDVTNLDTIPLKPLLNTIAEETMETENTDSNDIVDRILDTEIELGMKPCEDIDLSTVEKITDEKLVTEDESVTEPLSVSEVIPVEKPCEPIVEPIDVEKKDDNKSPTDVEVGKSKEVVDTNDTKAVASEVKLDENKMDTEDSKADIVENIVETAGKISPEETKGLDEACKTGDGTKIVTVDSKVNTLENKIESETKTDVEVSKVETEVANIATERKIDQDENKVEIENKIESDSKIVADVSTVETVADKNLRENEKESTKNENNKGELRKIEGNQLAENKETDTPQTESNTAPKDQIAVQTVVKEAKENPEEAKMETEVMDAQTNGSTTNGDAVVANVNGDSNKEEELNARLSVENGKEAVNGSNGDSVGEQGQGDNKVETEVSDIKLKTVAPDESRTDPVDQPTEA